MKIKLDRPIEYTSSANTRSMSINNKSLGDSDQRGKANYIQMNDASNNKSRVDEVDKTNRVDRVVASEKSSKTNGDYTNVVRQRNEKLNQYRKDLISQTATQTDAKSNVKREQAKKELVEKLSSSSDNIRRVQQEFNDSKEKLSTKIHEQNDSTAQAQSKLRESKRQLLSEIQKTNDANSQINQNLQQNQRELASKNVQEVAVSESKETSKEKQPSIEDRKAELVKKVIDNTSEDTTIKQKLAQYKRELANATTKREQLEQQTNTADVELQKYDVQENKVEITSTSTELEKIRETIQEQEISKNLNELLALSLDSIDSDIQTQLSNIDVTPDLPKVSKVETVKVETVTQPKVTKSTKNDVTSSKTKIETPDIPKNQPTNVVDFSTQVTPVSDYYEARNLTAIDVSLLSTTSTMSYSSSDNLVDISNEIATVSSTSTASIDADKQAIISKIAVDTDTSSEIQQKLREYQAEVRKINAQILSLTEDSYSSSALSYENDEELSKLDSFSIYAEELSCAEDVERVNFEKIIELASDLEEAEIMISTQEELNSVVKLLATEIKQDELLAKIAEQEQAIARNKILEKRESLIELAKQNNELLRTLNQRLSIITKKAVRNVVYSPTVISQRTRMIA